MEIDVDHIRIHKRKPDVEMQTGTHTQSIIYLPRVRLWWARRTIGHTWRSVAFAAVYCRQWQAWHGRWQWNCCRHLTSVVPPLNGLLIRTSRFWPEHIDAKHAKQFMNLSAKLRFSCWYIWYQTLLRLSSHCIGLGVECCRAWRIFWLVLTTKCTGWLSMILQRQPSMVDVERLRPPFRERP